MKFRFIAQHRGIWQTRQMCRTLGVSHGGFYEWMRRPESRRCRENRQLLVQIRASFEQSDRTYGSPRVWRDLRAWGFRCGKHRVERLMSAAALKARGKRRRLPLDEGVRPEHAIAANVLDRQFEASAPNQRWVADFTYIWSEEGWLYFAVVMDLFSRRIVGWATQNTLHAEGVLQALLAAVWRRKPKPGLVLHSDQGCQFTSHDWQSFLKDHGIVCSMSRRGNCHDNAVAESFYQLIKRERIRRKIYATRAAARSDVFDYIEMFYNPKRRHGSAGDLSPVEFEKRAGLSGL